MGSSNENSGYGPVLNPWDRDARAGRLVRRQRRGGGRRPRAVGDRHRHRRLDPPAGGAVRDRRAEAHLRRGLALRDDRLRLVARPVRPAHPRRDRRRAAAAATGGPRPVRLDLARHRRRRAAAHAPSASTACASACRGARERGHRAGRARGVRADAEDDRGARRRRRGDRAAARAARHLRLLRDRARRGERQPRPLRRRPLRPRAAERRRPAPSCTSRRAHDGFGAEVKRRIMLGTFALSSGYYEAYYGRAQKVRTKIADDFGAAFEKVDFVVTPTSPTRRVQARRAHRRPARDVPVRLLHGADAAGRHPGDLDPVRPVARALPVGFQLAGPAFSENTILDAALRARAGDRLRGGAGAR